MQYVLGSHLRKPKVDYEVFQLHALDGAGDSPNGIPFLDFVPQTYLPQAEER